MLGLTLTGYMRVCREHVVIGNPSCRWSVGGNWYDCEEPTAKMIRAIYGIDPSESRQFPVSLPGDCLTATGEAHHFQIPLMPIVRRTSAGACVSLTYTINRYTWDPVSCVQASKELDGSIYELGFPRSMLIKRINLLVAGRGFRRLLHARSGLLSVVVEQPAVIVPPFALAHVTRVRRVELIERLHYFQSLTDR